MDPQESVLSSGFTGRAVAVLQESNVLLESVRASPRHATFAESHATPAKSSSDVGQYRTGAVFKVDTLIKVAYIMLIVILDYFFS